MLATTRKEFWLPQRHAPADVGGLLAVVGHVERQAALSLGIVHAGKVLQFCREKRYLKAAGRSHRMLSMVLSLIMQLYLAEQWATCGNRNRNAQTKLKGGGRGAAYMATTFSCDMCGSSLGAIICPSSFMILQGG